MRTRVDRLRFHAKRQRFAGAVEQSAAFGQHDPFFQMLPLAELHQFFALQHLQLNGASADDQKQSQKQYFGDAKAALIAL